MNKIKQRETLSENYVEGITAGTPLEADGIIDEYFQMPAAFVDGQKGHFFTLKVKGDSMVDAGIEDEDLVICRQSEEARADDIVAAFIPGEGSTLKRYCRDDEGPFLWAENSNWDAQERDFGRNFKILGIAIKVLKNI